LRFLHAARKHPPIRYKGEVYREGVDELMAMYPDVYDRETAYVDGIAEFLNNPVDPDAPNRELALTISADSVTVLMGIVWRVF